MKSKVIQGDCLKVLPTLPRATMIWADPPDNIGMKYEEYDDKRDRIEYAFWLQDVSWAGTSHSDIFWLSYNAKWQVSVMKALIDQEWRTRQYRQFIWHFTFGQNRQTDFVSSYRPILRIIQTNAIVYPDTVRVPSARQVKYNDKRANPKGKLPDDVWEYPRVCGTFKERKKWHSCQHPKDLLRRIVKFSTKPGDLVIDMFAGSGNMIEVCQELSRDCIGIDISEFYCKKIAEETGAELEVRDDSR